MKSMRNVVSGIKSQLGGSQVLDLDNHDSKAEHEVDAVKQAYAALVKAMDEAYAHSDEPQKQIKKVKQHAFGTKIMASTLEAFPVQDPPTRLNSGFGPLLGVFARIQLDLGQLTSDYHKGIHHGVYKNLSSSLESSTNNMAIERKKVKVAQAELDKAKAKFEALQKKDDGTGKLETAKLAFDAASVELKKQLERYSIALDKFLSQDKQIGMPLVDMIDEQINYHKTAQMLLEQASAKIHGTYSALGATGGDRIFGGHIPDTHVSPFLLECCAAINRDGLKVEGIFRKQGSTSKTRALRAAFTKGTGSLASPSAYDHDINNVAALVKIYFRELIEPLLVSTFYDAWMESITVEDHTEKLYALQGLVTQLPQGHFETLKFISKFCANVAQYHEENKMNFMNLALVFGPNLLWPVTDTTSGSLAQDNAAVTSVVETLFTYAEWFFPAEDDDVDATTAEFPAWADAIIHEVPTVVEPDNQNVAATIDPLANRVSMLKEAPKKRAPIAPNAVRPTAPKRKDKPTLPPAPTDDDEADKNKDFKEKETPVARVPSARPPHPLRAPLMRDPPPSNSNAEESGGDDATAPPKPPPFTPRGSSS
eukprot:m.113089 g.113089  ORF g.113089 m.113089 type:complete len:594 (-) comp28244_c0_seq2:749-2530(-)